MKSFQYWQLQEDIQSFHFTAYQSSTPLLQSSKLDPKLWSYCVECIYSLLL